LALSGNQVGVNGISSLISVQEMGDLRVLDLTQTGLGDTGVRLLARWPLLAQLTELHLGGNDLGEGGLDALLRSAHWPALETLSLDRSNFGDQ
jgi:hypothetical protein